MEFLSIFGKVVAKNRAFGNIIIFLQQFFQFRGGAFSVSPPPGGAYGRKRNKNVSMKKFHNFTTLFLLKLPSLPELSRKVKLLADISRLTSGQ